MGNNVDFTIHVTAILYVKLPNDSTKNTAFGHVGGNQDSHLVVCRNLQMEYVDLYLVHWPMTIKPSKRHFPMKREDIMPMDLRGVWQAMEECHRFGLAKMIGVSNFTTKKLQELLAIAKIPPAVNQVCVDQLDKQ